MTISELLSIVVVLFFVDTQCCEDDVIINGAVYVQSVVASGGGKGEVIGNDGNSSGEGTQLWDRDLYKVHRWLEYHSDIQKPV